MYHRTWILMAAIAAGCGGSKSAPPADRAGTTAAPRPSRPHTTSPAPGAAGPGPTQAAGAGAVLPAITREQREAYRKHLRTGRALADKTRYGDAVKHFEAALAAIPGGERALSELGWAAFQAGDHDKALDASRKAVAAATNPRVRAASLYNLGRVLEAQGKRDEAARIYRESLALRPNDTVASRLAGLGQAPSAAGDVGAPSADICTDAQATDRLCPCFIDATREAMPDRDGDGKPDSEPTCEVTKVRGVDAQIIKVAAGYEHTYWYLAGRGAEGWAAIAELGHVENPMMFGIYEELAVAKAEVRQVGKRTIVWIETRHERTDRDAGVNERERLSGRHLTICVMPGGPDDDWTCPLQVPLEQTYALELLQEEDAAFLEENGPIEHTSEPFQDTTKVDVRLSDVGTVTIILVSGAKEDLGYLGPHKLW